MKFIILILLFSCTKVVDQKIRKLTSREPVLERLETDGRYAEKIDVMVAFLWPVRVTDVSQRQAIRSLIGGARSLKELQDTYFQKKLELARAWKTEECDCVLNGICEDTPPQSDYERCTELEEQTFANERNLPAIYEIVEKLKFNVKTSGGEWLKTHSDYPEGPVSEMNFKESLLNLPVFAPLDEPFPYSALRYNLRNRGKYDSLDIRFPDAGGRGEWQFDMVIQRTPEAMKFQGKLFLRKRNETREGIIYWMNPVII